MDIRVSVRRGRASDRLRKAVERAGSRSEIASRINIPAPRMSQLLNGKHPSLKLEQAIQLERLIGAEPGEHFVLDHPLADCDTLAPYLAKGSSR